MLSMVMNGLSLAALRQGLLPSLEDIGNSGPVRR